MEFMLDSANLEEVREIKSIGLLEGLTTNPLIIKKGIQESNYSGNFIDYAKKLLEITQDKPLFFQVTALDKQGILKQATVMYKTLQNYGNVHIKIPINTSLTKDDVIYEGFSAIRELSSEGIPILATAIVTPVQAYLSSKAGAKYAVLMLRPYDNIIAEKLRLGNLGEEGYLDNRRVLIELMRRKKSLDSYLSGEEILRRAGRIFSVQNLTTKLLIAGIRNPVQVSEVLETEGVSSITLPYKVLRELFNHEGTRKFVKETYKAATPNSSYGKFLENGK